MQGGVALVMVMNGDMIVHSLGHLFSGEFLQLPHWIAAVFTVIALIGGINAINMIDGMDGLSGSISLASLALMGVVAFQAGDQDNLLLICALSGGLSGFLYYNLRYASKRSARVFLGDNGSMLGHCQCYVTQDVSGKITFYAGPFASASLILKVRFFCYGNYCSHRNFTCLLWVNRLIGIVF